MSRLRFSSCSALICLIGGILSDCQQAEGGPLDPAKYLTLLNGVTSSTGAVSTGHSVFAVTLSGSSLLTIDVNVTKVLPGAAFTDNDTHLFLFRSDGYQLAFNDDKAFDDLQSQITDAPIAAPGTYFFAVTTYDNVPVLNGSNLITGWQDQGKGSVEFQVSVYSEKQADFDFDDDVDGADLLIWQRNLGKVSGAAKRDGDATKDGKVLADDLDLWRGGFTGNDIPAEVNGYDLLSWQPKLGMSAAALKAQGEATGDGRVLDELAVWQTSAGTTNFGTVSVPESPTHLLVLAAIVGMLCRGPWRCCTN